MRENRNPVSWRKERRMINQFVAVTPAKAGA